MAKANLTIKDSEGNIRADKYFASTFPEYSRAALAKLFMLNLIKLHGEPIQAGHKLRPGETIEYDLGPLQAKPDVVPLPILFENDDVIVVDKPAGIISHARGRFWQEASVASFIRDRISGMDGERGGIVHRLDRATSGVMICAKNEVALKHLQKQFHDRIVEKTYLAVVEKPPKENAAKIVAPIIRSVKNPKQFTVSSEGKHAETEYKILKEVKNGILLKLRPLTGRTHQLRVHLNYLGRPIIGDELYNGKPFNRLLLHANELSIILPGNDKPTTFISKPPKDFA